MEQMLSKAKNVRRTIFRVVWKTLASTLLVVIGVAVATSFSLIYNFAEPRKFEGADIYNPYKSFDTTSCWKRANFHTHTRVEGILNECNHWPAEVLEYYEGLGYDIVTFSNHNELTLHPHSADLQVNLYEHGYNLFKYHKLAFGAAEVWRFDHLLPLLASQKQFQIEQLSKDADIVQLNHPLRTPTLSKSQLAKLSGYKLIELDSGKSTENEYWDAALSAGRYSFGVANDDLHYPDRTYKIALRCNFLVTPSAKYEDILNTLNEGCFYSMRLPDYGNGDWAIKREKNREVPSIRNIGMQDSVVYVRFSEQADLVKVIGQEHTLLMSGNNCDSIAYAMKTTDPYVRVAAYFPDGEVIYTNPFARYDSTLQATPFCDGLAQVNFVLTILFNLLLLLLCVADGYLLYKVIKR